MRLSGIIWNQSIFCCPRVQHYVDPTSQNLVPRPHSTTAVDADKTLLIRKKPPGQAKIRLPVFNAIGRQATKGKIRQGFELAFQILQASGQISAFLPAWYFEPLQIFVFERDNQLRKYRSKLEPLYRRRSKPNSRTT
ncbi:hypothetical protein MTR_5g077870 [Medicago truncatula]|uniref:Uncharacterized protein n=1 Tax=Medicago truncatula TaxID=3880 RepID=G7KG27_MEDTR|nr:hypothetical protein MTR_5g077870 [Medicago truncatula]